ncbi:hypothetical protein [Bacterioplanoides sp.]|uniref:hypothetical protein n=1 Tax=Bacterioplanoides sp. TaxID=2066072 RepID=UPI003B004E88
MKFNHWLLAALLSTSLVGCGSDDDNDTNPAAPQTPNGGNVDSGDSGNGDSGDDGIDEARLNQLFPKTTRVFGITLAGSATTPDDKLLHAANVMAEYLDNDEDGNADNQAVVDQLVQSKARLLMAADGDELETLFRQLFDIADMGSSEDDDDSAEEPEGGDAIQDLLADEVNPGSAGGQFDGTLEEVLHLITHVGYAQVYPDVFGEEPDSAIADAMDAARGGRFLELPDSYPNDAWYTYDDDTCEYDCMVTEYTYWALTSVLGAQQFNGRLEQIQDEWQLNTADLVRTRDAAVYSILTNDQYKLPTQLPDGQYAASQFEVTNSAAN